MSREKRAGLSKFLPDVIGAGAGALAGAATATEGNKLRDAIAWGGAGLLAGRTGGLTKALPKAMKFSPDIANFGIGAAAAGLTGGDLKSALTWGGAGLLAGRAPGLAKIENRLLRGAIRHAPDLLNFGVGAGAAGLGGGGIKDMAVWGGSGAIAGRAGGLGKNLSRLGKAIAKRGVKLASADYRPRGTLFLTDDKGRVFAGKTDMSKPGAEATSPYYFPGGGILKEEGADRVPTKKEIAEGIRTEALEELGVSLDDLKVLTTKGNVMDMPEWWQERQSKKRGVNYKGLSEYYATAREGSKDDSLYNVEGDAFDGDYYPIEQVVEALEGRAARDNAPYAKANLQQAQLLRALLEKNAKAKKPKGTATKRDPKKWAAAKARAKAKMGGKWSARAAQLAVKYYKDSGGRYSGKKPTAKNNKLKKWTKQDWQWSGERKKKSSLIKAILEKEAKKKGKGVYLPAKAIDSLKSSEKGRKKLKAAVRKKTEATRKGEQYSDHGLHKGKNRSKVSK